jgi:CubicO group peptidase (beta-lactamase class C family)
MLHQTLRERRNNAASTLRSGPRNLVRTDRRHIVSCAPLVRRDRRGIRHMRLHSFCTARGLVPGILLALSCSAAPAAEPAYPHADEPIGTVEDIYDGTLLPDAAVATFRNIDRLFPTRTIRAGGTVKELPEAERQLDNVRFEVDGQTYDLFDVMALDNFTALLVLKNGEIAYESYQRGNTRDTRWMSMSVAKSITSTLAAIAIKEGLLAGLDAPVVDYVPALKGSAYDGVSLRDVLMMSSGVRWNETYTDPQSDRRALLQAQIGQKPGSAMELMERLPRAAEPGTVNTYSTGETQVLGEIVHGAVGRPLADYLSEKIWIPYGMEADATWWLDSPDGMEIGGSGISATLRDYGRFGLFFLNEGVIDGTSVLPDGWTGEAAGPTRLKDGTALDYGYMWWTGWTEPAIADGAYAAIGIQGQNIYINPARQVVIVTFGAQPKPTGKEPIDPLVFFDAVAAALD